MDVLNLLSGLAQLANLLLVPAVVYIVRIEVRLSRLVALIESHEKADDEKFSELFGFKRDLDRRGQDALMGRGGN
jgi:hypothetical protein